MTERSPKRGCIGIALFQRLETWSLLHEAGYALRPARGNHWNEIDPELAIKYVKSVLWVFTLRGKYNIVDPFIADDFGGEEKAWRVILDMREVIENLKSGKHMEAKLAIHKYQQVFYHHALDRYHECLEGKIDAEKNISYRHDTRKIEATQELIEHNKKVMEKVMNDRTR